MIDDTIIRKLIEVKTGLCLDNVIQLIYDHYRKMLYESYNIFELARCKQNMHLVINKNKMIAEMMLSNNKEYDLRSSYYDITQISEDKCCIRIYDMVDGKQFMQIDEGDRYTLCGDEYTIMHITNDVYFCDSGKYSVVIMNIDMNMYYIYRLCEFMQLLYTRDITYLSTA